MSFSNNTEDPIQPLYFWWSVSLLFEGVFIFLGNLLAIVVFWRRRQFALKRATYLLINLAFADLLVGVGVMVAGLVGISITPFSKQWLHRRIIAMFIYFASTASICSLTVVAVERAFAIAKPLKHRTASTAYYIHAVRLVWAMATIIIVCVILSAFLVIRALMFVVVSFFSFCLLIICLSYFIIWWLTSKRSREHTQRDQQNRKLARTLLIVTFLSLVTWIPCQVLMMIMREDGTGFSGTFVLVFLFFEFANSFINPFVYFLRMPEFRRESKLLLGCSGREDVIPREDV